MLRVLRHYLPLRKALLVLSETALLSAVLAAGMTSHLWEVQRAVSVQLAMENLSRQSAWRSSIISSILLAIVCQLALSFNELYDFRISSSRYERAKRFVGSAGTALALTLGLMVLAHFWGETSVVDFPGLTLSQELQTFVFTLLLGFGLLYIWRTLFHAGLRRIKLNERVLVLGEGHAAHELAKEVVERPGCGYDIVGLLPTKASESGSELPPGGDRRRPRLAAVGAENFPSLPEVLTAASAVRDFDTSLTEGYVLQPLELELGENSPKVDLDDETAPALLRTHALFDLVREKKVDVVAVALEDRRNLLPTAELLRCRLDGISVVEHEAIYEQITGKISVTALRPSYLIFNEGFARHPWAELVKRWVDFVLALVIFALTWPFMLLTALAVRLESPGPVLFSQERVGKNGESFTLFKFRSMRADAEKLSGPVWASENDPRITRVGRFIRKTRLDELPQLFNVLAGTMSLVGPRPERPTFVEDLSEQIPYYRQRHTVQPGLTGWAQINYPY
ncbi:MAG: exopolysaccharide biosynthesis polyprenyl glycosylphosphotransferase, partial [Planctomycetota bacterium]